MGGGHFWPHNRQFFPSTPSSDSVPDPRSPPPHFDYFLAQNCIRKLYFMLNTPKFALILLWGHFWPHSRQFFPSTPSSDSVPNVSPPIWLRPQRRPKIVPKSKSPHQKFCEKPLYASRLVLTAFAILYRDCQLWCLCQLFFPPFSSYNVNFLKTWWQNRH